MPGLTRLQPSSSRFESSKDARERLALEGITKADDVQMVVRKTLGAGRGAFRLPSRSTATFSSSRSDLLTPILPNAVPYMLPEDGKTQRYVLIDGTDGLKKLEKSSGADEIWSVHLPFQPGS